MQQERAGTEGVVAELGARCRALEQWLEANEWKAAALGGAGAGGAAPSSKGKGKAAGGVDVDAAAAAVASLDVNKLVVPADDLCRQALAAQARARAGGFARLGPGAARWGCFPWRQRRRTSL